MLSERLLSLRLLSQLQGEDLKLPKVSSDASVITNILNVLFLAAGALSVIFVIVGGIRYATSGGNPEQAAKAKNTIIYAVIGLIISLLATAIVNFVIRRL